MHKIHVATNVRFRTIIRLRFFILANVRFKIFVYKRIFAELYANFTHKRATIRKAANIRYVLLQIIYESLSQVLGLN
jgi:hypothetical protein